jgi:lysophospholipase L1-like esterase
VGTRRVAGVALVALAVVMAVEAGFRLLFWDEIRAQIGFRQVPARGGHTLDGDYQPAPVPALGYEPRVGRKMGAHTINAQTIPEPEDLPVAKPPGQTRIITLGDSITMGEALSSYEDSYPEVLERALTGAGLDVNVINLGVNGYDTRREYERLKLRGLALQPDVVIVGYCVNDAFDLNDFFFATVPGAYDDYVRELERLDPIVAAQRPLREDCTLCVRWIDFLVYRARTARLERGTPNYILRSHLDPTSFGGVERAMAQIVEASRGVGAKTVLAIFPEIGLLDPARYGYKIVNEKVSALGRRLGMEVVDLLEPLAREGVDLHVTRWDNLHPNARGHRAAARALLEALRRIGVPPGLAGRTVEIREPGAATP